MIDRRGFLAGMVATGLGLGEAAAKAAAARKLKRIGLQIYTVRSLLPQDFEDTIRKVREIGYSEIEFGPFPVPDIPPQQVRDIIRRVGLDPVAGHVNPRELKSGWDRTLKDARFMGLQFVVCAVSPENAGTIDDYRAFARLLNQAGETARSAGIQLGFHCHDTEFAPIGGAVPYDILLSETNPDMVAMEMDLYWVTKANRDPVEYFTRYPGRFRLVHVKDMDRTPARGMTDVGQGIIDWARLFAHAEQAGIEHYFVEHDEPASPIDTIKRSYNYLATLEF